jgi:hypothetical protein
MLAATKCIDLFLHYIAPKVNQTLEWHHDIGVVETMKEQMKYMRYLVEGHEVFVRSLIYQTL